MTTFVFLYKQKVILIFVSGVTSVEEMYHANGWRYMYEQL